MYAGFNVVFDNEGFEARECSACRLHLTDHINTVTFIGDHFANSPYLSLDASESGVCKAFG